MPMRSQAILCIYFLVIAHCLWITSGSWLRHQSKLRYKALACIFLLLTWERMFNYFRWSYLTYHSINGAAIIGESKLEQWLSNTQLFQQAWRLVTADPESILISQRVCFATVAWTIFLRKSQGRVPYTIIYMLLGQLVAISFAMNLYFAALSVANPSDLQSTRGTKNNTDSITKHGWSDILEFVLLFTSTVSIVLIPFIQGTGFLLNLLILHGTLLVVLLLPPSTLWRFTHLEFAILAISSLNTAYSLYRSNFAHVVARIHQTPAHGSIGCDLLGIVISIWVWRISRVGRAQSPKYLSTLMETLAYTRISF